MKQAAENYQVKKFPEKNLLLFRGFAGRTGDDKIPTLDDIEEQYIRKVIRESGKNKGEICEILGISRPTFDRKLEKYGIAFEKEG